MRARSLQGPSPRFVSGSDEGEWKGGGGRLLRAGSGRCQHSKESGANYNL